MLAGDEIARIASGQYYLRLSLPERHAATIREGDAVRIGGRGLSAAVDAHAGPLQGRIVKVYPEIVDGRVTADVEVAGIGDYFVGERTLVTIPVGTRQALAVPPAALGSRHGIDYVRLADGARSRSSSARRSRAAARGWSRSWPDCRPGDRIVVPDGPK